MDFNGEAVPRDLTGPAGGIVKVWDINGYYWPQNPDFPDHPMSPKKLENVKARKDDVFICSYPKSGLHWLWEIVRMLKLGQAEPAPKVMEEYMMEMQRDLEAIQAMTSPRIFPTHMRFNMLPKSFIDQRCKIIYIKRDPRAVAVSFCRFVSAFNSETGMKFEGTWDDFFPMFINNKVPFNGWFEMEKYWENVILGNPNYPIHVVEFESLKQDTVAEIQKVANFLNIDCSVDFCDLVAKHTSFTNLKSTNESVLSKNIADWYTEKKYPIFQKGTIDGWKNVFTVSQHEQFLERFEKEMKGYLYKLRAL